MSLAEIIHNYEQSCNEFKIPPCVVFSQTLNQCMEHGSFLTHVILQGNSKALFNARINDLQCIAIVDACIAAGTVEVLDLSRNRITNTGASAILRLLTRNQLRELDLSHNLIETDGCSQLMDGILPQNPLSVLKLTGNPIGNEGAMKVAMMLQMNKRLLHLDISDCDVETETVIAFATVLLTNTQLQHLGIANPRLFSLQEEPLVHFSDMLRSNSSLTSLDLSKHRMRDRGVQVLCEYLAVNQTLRTLSLRCNLITMEGGSAIGRLLETSGLVSLDLSGNRVDNLGAMSIARALESNKQLTHLNLTHNNIGGEGLAALAHALSSNETLSKLFLWGNRFTPPAADALGKIFSTSRSLTETDIVIYYTDGVAGVAQRN